MTGLRFDHYDWAGHREAMLRFGTGTGPLVLAALPLFEEANRTRHFLVTILRTLAARGLEAILPDLPGTGESPVETGDARLSYQRAAFAAIAAGLDRPVYAVSLRSGALIDADAALAGRWHLSPQTGADLLRDLNRTRAVATPAAQPRPSEFAGNLLSPLMLEELQAAQPKTGSSVRTIRLDTDPRPADATIPGTPLWRRAEPATDAALAIRLADDITAWIAACEA